MAIYSGEDMPEEVGRTTMDVEVKNWLKDGPVLGSHEPIAAQRAAHDRFIDADKPPIGKVEHRGLVGPHGTIPVRCYHPSKPGLADGAALVYLHGGGYIVGSLDQPLASFQRAWTVPRADRRGDFDPPKACGS
jgi:acetyl esterase/lipase